MLILFLRQADHPYTGFDTLIILEVLLAAFISLTYAPWMAAYTEMVEAKNPALVGTGLALWGWILRLTVGLSFIFLPAGHQRGQPGGRQPGLRPDRRPPAPRPFNVQQFQLEHPQSVAFAEANASWLKVLSEPENAPIVAAANANPTPANLAALQKAVGPVVFAKVVANMTSLKTLVVPYQTQLDLPVRPPDPAERRCSTAWPSHPSSGSTGSGCASAGMVLFIPTIFLNRGRWSPKRAREDEEKHDADVAEELRELVGASA